MSWAYLHIIVNHFAIILTVMGALSALLALALRRRGIWLYAVATLTLAAVAAYPAVFTGERAEHEVEEVWYVEHDAVESHEEAGKIALWVLLVMGAVSAYAWWVLARGGPTRNLPVWLGALVVLSAATAMTAVIWTANLGGKIVHEAPGLLQDPGLGGS